MHTVKFLFKTIEKERVLLVFLTALPVNKKNGESVQALSLLKRFPFCSPTILYYNYEVIVKFFSLSNLYI